MISEVKAPESLHPSTVRWNFIIIVIDASFFFCAFAFLDPVAVLPVLLNDLSGSRVVVGLMSGLQRAGWLVPQLLAASFVLHRPRKKPFVLFPCLIGRIPFYLLAVIFNLDWAARNPKGALLCLVIGYTFFFFSDGLSGVPWHDIIGRTIPAQLRGRFFGSIQFMGGLLAIGSGAIVHSVLADKSLIFPHNYGRLFIFLSAGMTLSTLALALIREPHGPAFEDPQPLPKLLRAIPSTLRQFPRLRQAIVGQILCGIGGIAVPFYAVYAESKLGLPASSGGAFIWAGIIGSVGTSVLWAYLSDRHGSTRAIRGASWLVVAAPISAVVIPAVARAQAMEYLYPLVFLLNGAIWGGMWLGFTNYILEIAPDDLRPLFLGLQATLCAPTVVMPLIGGWLLSVVSYQMLFCLSAAAGIVGLIYVRRLVDPRLAPAQAPT
jgi:MFS family permease